MRRAGRITRVKGIVVAAIASVLAVAAAAPAAWAPPGAPTGLTPMAQDGKVVLGWQASAGATSYEVVRGTAPDDVTTVVGTTGARTLTDGTAANGTLYYYAVRAVSDAGTSPPSAVVSARPRAASCATGNAIVRENCRPGTTDWKTPDAAGLGEDGLDGFTSRSSIAAGESVDLKVRAPVGTPYDVEIYRTGWYGGDQGRLFGTITGLTAVDQPACADDTSTGRLSCAGWTTTARLTTTDAWPTGVYVIKLVRTDTGAANFTILTVRDDSRAAPVAMVIPTATYQAYNEFGGRSLYAFNSSGPPTVSGEARAVKVSYDRPYRQSVTGHHDFYTASDVQLAGWLERQGYDLSYIDSTDVNDGRGSLGSRKAIVLSSHDEYQSTEMRNALTNARNDGVSIASFGANTMFWRARFEDLDRTLVVYKTTEGGAADPVTPTTTWRDPAGANKPENALFGNQYVGDDSGTSYPLYVTAAQGKHRVWRYTSLPSMPGPRAQISFHIVGWEWDRRVDNGAEPAGVQAVSSSPVQGNILQDAGHVYAPGSEVAEATYYTAASGAVVFSAGTNQWSWGLGRNMSGVGEPDELIQQATANVLGDMAVRPSTPDGVVLDATGPLTISARTPVAGATGAAVDAPLRVDFDRPLDPDTVTAGAFELTGPGGAAVARDVTYLPDEHAVRVTPAEPLGGNTQYTLNVTTAVKGWNGAGLAADSSAAFTTGAGIAPAVTARTPAAGADRVPFDATVTATLSRTLDAATVTAANVTLSSAAGSVAATVHYDAANRRITLTPAQPLASNTTYTARLGTGVHAFDGTPLAAEESWSFTTFDAVAVTERTPAPLAGGISPQAVVRAGFSRQVDPATLTASTFSLTGPEGAVPATISYDASARVATLLPDAPLQPAATYTATVAAGVQAPDGAPLIAASSWTFTTALVDPPAPQVTGATPAGGATDAGIDDPVTVTFDRPLDPDSLTASSFQLRDAGGAPLAAALSYDAATRTARLTPSATLAADAVHEVRLTTAVRSEVGAPLSTDADWTFTTRGCPCSTMSTLAPETTFIDTQDGRQSATQLTLELGTRLTVDRSVRLTKLRFYKSPGETGTHVGRVWTGGGGLIASTTFTGETASGWQEQALSAPVTVRPGRTYVVSVGANHYYVSTQNGLAAERSAGPLHTVAGGNGVYAEAAGSFPTLSWADSNYFVDAVVEDGSGTPQTPAVTAVTPLDGAAGAGIATAVKADFSVALDAATVTDSTFTLRPLGGSPVAATVTYDEHDRQAKLVPAAPLEPATAYSAQLSSGVQAADGTPLDATAWQFTTASADAPQITATSPADDATQVTPSTAVRATFAAALDPTTVTGATFRLQGPAGQVAASVSYDAATHTATLQPSAALSPSTTYTATADTGIHSDAGVPLAAPVTWHLTTSACPCQLFPDTSWPNAVQRPVQDGRPGPGPFSYEMGVKIRVSQPAQLTAVRFYKSPGEGGTHVGRVWTASGTQIASVTFSGESSSGWQQQQLASPVDLSPGQTYVVTVGINDYYVVTTGGLSSSVSSGPLSSVADGADGLFGPIGSFPTDTWGSSNYFIDTVVN